LVAVASLVFLASGQPTGVVNINETSDERGNLSSIPASNVSAQAGNVTELNIEAVAITEAWQGYYGNITGTFTLEDAQDNVFYNWSGLGSIAGEVYASRDQNVDWSTINCTNQTEINDEDAYLGKTGNDPDSVNQTFNETNHDRFAVGSTVLGPDECPSTNAYTDSGKNESLWQQVLLSDGDPDTVYTTIIDEDQVGFNNKTYDFQLLVGENGNETSQAPTTYYFYTELS
jgi:hypothetical protein